ncbi:hypothetical protein EVAR_37650_1 [Eumeta japonica]|uniref:Uncharacterized protein n=1 Tax=Eumeta variegata TaxID=151549 RepID=A0A4C1VQ01_EUMVA|nr:hypothetical protein EVAR_37650_1 [Eumeta japonica]
MPVSAHESQEEKLKRHKMLDVLADRVIEMTDMLEGDDLKIYVHKEVKKFMREAPMWSPDSKCCDNSLKEKMSNNLGESLYKIICKKPNILDETISDWLRDIPLKKNDDLTFDKKRLQKDLKKRIMAIFSSRPSCDTYFSNVLAEEIKNTLEQWVSDFDDVCSKNRFLTTISEQLADLVKDLAAENENGEQNEIKSKIRDWIERDPELVKHEIDQDAINELSNTLTGVLHGDAPRPNEIQDEITQWLSLHTTIVPEEQSISRLTNRLLPMATSTPRDSADTTIYSSIEIGTGTLVDNVLNVLNKSGLQIRPEVRQRLTLDIVDILAASPEQMCARNDDSLDCDQSSRERLEESIHEVFEEHDIHPNNENETIKNLVNVMESINVDCDESCFERSFQKKVLPEVSKLLSHCSHCPPDKGKLSTTLDELKARFGEIKNRTARGISVDAGPSRSGAHEKFAQEPKSIKVTISQWADELPLKSEPKVEVKKVKDDMVNELSEEIANMQRQQEKEKVHPSRYQQRIREKVTRWLKKLPLQPDRLTNTEEMADELVKRMAMANEFIENSGGPNQAQLENTIMNWFKNSTFYRQITSEDRRREIQRVPQLANQLKEIQAGLLNQTTKRRDRRFLYSQATDLIEKLRAIPYNPEPKTNFNKYLTLLKREVAIWIDDFPVDYADIEGEETRKNKAAGQLAEKLFMVQMRHPSESDQEAYEEELYETISRWLTALNRPMIDANKHRLTVRLIMRINDLESRMANAVMQTVPLKPYKERYLENIAAGAVPLHFVNKQEEKMHQEIIHNMANAFINRNYKLEDPQQRADLIETLSAHIRDFLDYVETLPDDQPNYEALRAELEEVLKQVPVPDLEKAKKEQKIKQMWKVVTAWYKSLPVDPAVDSEEEIDRVRMLNYLNIKMAKIRKDLDVSSDEGNWDERIVKEIFNFLRTLPLHRNDCAALNEFTDDLLTTYLDAERFLSRSLPQKFTDGNLLTEQLPEGRFEIGGPCGKKKDEKRPKQTVPQIELHEKNLIEKTSDPSLINRTADQVHFQRPRVSIDNRPLVSAPPECPVACRHHSLTPQPTAQGEYVSYYDPEFVDERFLDESLENYRSFKEKAQFNSSIMPTQDQPSKRTEPCRGCAKPSGQTPKSPHASMNTSRTPQSPKPSQYHKSCIHPTDKEDQTIPGSLRSGRHSPKALDQSIRPRTQSPKSESDRFGATGVSLKLKSQDERQCNTCQNPIMSLEEQVHELPAHHTSQVSESDKYRYGQTRYREHYDGPQSMPAKPADYAISTTLQREIDLARQIGMYDEPATAGTGLGIPTGSRRGPDSSQVRRQGPCIPISTQDGQQHPPGTDDDVPVYCPCIKKMLNCRSFGFFFRPSCPMSADDGLSQCSHCCNLCPCPTFAQFNPPYP